MTSDGSAYTRFKRALGTGNLALVVAAAAELPQVGRRDALEVCPLLRRQPRPLRAGGSLDGALRTGSARGLA